MAAAGDVPAGLSPPLQSDSVLQAGPTLSHSQLSPHILLPFLAQVGRDKWWLT